MGLVDYDECLALQHRLVYESAGRDDGQITLLLCEHPSIISIGRHGSRADVRQGPEQLISRQLELRWVARGGGAILHLPGQLAVYPIVPLRWHGWSVGNYLRRLQTGLENVTADLGFAAQTREGRFGLWGRRGQVAAMGVAVRGDISCHGIYLNVATEKSVLGYVDTNPRRSPLDPEKPVMSSLLAEMGRPAKMTKVRALMVQHLSDAFAASRFHMHTGHPLLSAVRRSSRGSVVATR